MTVTKSESKTKFAKMACPIDAKEIEKLKMFIQFCSMSPHILQRPELEFFKTFVEKLGGKVPLAPGESS